MKKYSYRNKSNNNKIKILEIYKRKKQFFITFEFKDNFLLMNGCEIDFSIIIFCKINTKKFFMQNVLTYKNMEILNIDFYSSQNDASKLTNLDKMFLFEQLSNGLKDMKIIIDWK